MATNQDLQSILSQIGNIVRQIPSTVLGAVQNTVIPIVKNVEESIKKEIFDAEVWLAIENSVNMECLERARKRAAENLRRMGGHVSSDSKRLYRALTSAQFEAIRKLPDGRFEYKLTLKRGNVYYGDIVNKLSSIVITPRNKKYLKFTGYRDYTLEKGEGNIKYRKAVLWWSNAKGYMDEAFEHYSRPDVVEQVRQEMYQRYKEMTIPKGLS